MLTTSPTNSTVLLHRLLAIVLLTSLWAGFSPAWAADSDTWQEEVLLHDGQKMVVERSQTYGGRHEVGQSAPAREHTIRFSLPNSSNIISWTSEYGEGLGRTNFNLLALHVKDKTPYVIAEPNLCLAYNQWGRPNPPYVIFQWSSNEWQRIGIEALPPEFSTMNVSQRTARMWARDRNGTTLTAKEIQAENATNQPQYRSILREPMNYDPSCIPMVTNGKGLWLAEGRFKKKPSFDACLASCKSEDFDETTCPCNRLFKNL